MKVQSTNSTVMKNFGTSYDINAINKLLMKAGIKSLTADQVKNMTKQQIKDYISANKKIGRNFRWNAGKVGREFRKNAKLPASENYKQAQLMHGTIRQGLAELGALGSQALAPTTISKVQESKNAIEQNTSGGTAQQGDTITGTSGTNTEHGPVYSHRGRSED